MHQSFDFLKRFFFMNKEEIVNFLKNLQTSICSEFETLEASKKFERNPWSHKEGGGGIISTLRGEVFEKAAVNFSAVSGKKFPMNDAFGPFFATGVSLITHMKNPHAPTVHMNVRYIETEEKSWFGGGFDLTPMGFVYDDDTKHFHNVAKETLMPFGDTLYDEFSENAKEYFFIKHRNKERGVGGIFFDHFNTGDQTKDFEMWKSIGENFIRTIMPIYKRRCSAEYSEADKLTQLKYRAHYVEFNLVYDRGTRFGFNSGGNTEAILCSMPPNATW